MDRSAYNEAIANLRMALGLAEELSDSPGRRLLRLGLQTSYGQALLYGRGHGSLRRLLHSFGPAELAARVEDAARNWRSRNSVGSLVRAELASMQDIAQEFLSDAQRYPKSPEAASHIVPSGQLPAFRGDYVEARVHLERALARLRIPPSHHLTSLVMARTRDHGDAQPCSGALAAGGC